LQVVVVAVRMFWVELELEEQAVPVEVGLGGKTEPLQPQAVLIPEEVLVDKGLIVVAIFKELLNLAAQVS